MHVSKSSCLHLNYVRKLKYNNTTIQQYCDFLRQQQASEMFLSDQKLQICAAAFSRLQRGF